MSTCVAWKSPPMLVSPALSLNSREKPSTATKPSPSFHASVLRSLILSTRVKTTPGSNTSMYTRPSVRVGTLGKWLACVGHPDVQASLQDSGKRQLTISRISFPRHLSWIKEESVHRSLSTYLPISL